MNKETNLDPGDPDMLEEYNFSGGVRGKYAERYAAGSNIVVLAPDVAPMFPDSDAVNDALRLTNAATVALSSVDSTPSESSPSQ